MIEITTIFVVIVLINLQKFFADVNLQKFSANIIISIKISKTILFNEIIIYNLDNTNMMRSFSQIMNTFLNF